MKYLIEETKDGIGSSGDPMIGFEGRSEFSIAAESIRLEAEHDAQALGEDPQSLPVRLEVASKIAALRLSWYIKSTGQTQAEVAAQLGLSRGHLNRVLNDKAPLGYTAYKRLFQLETITAILSWIERTKSTEEQDHFETLFSGIRVADPYARVLFCLGSVFGESALQDFMDSTGTLTPIPAEADAPEALHTAIRKAAA